RASAAGSGSTRARPCARPRTDSPAGWRSTASTPPQPGQNASGRASPSPSTSSRASSSLPEVANGTWAPLDGPTNDHAPIAGPDVSGVSYVPVVATASHRNGARGVDHGQTLKATRMSTNPHAAAGWYPQGDGTQRYWEGYQWTERIAAYQD